jgi:iron-sulfur cluster assembly accessory protein
MADAIVQLSTAAVEQIRELQDEHDMAGHALRLAIRGGGCSGYSYQLEFVEAPELEDDTEYEFQGIRVIVGALKRDYLKGTVIDFEDTLLEAGFKIKNPNAKRHCGCGESFDIDEAEGTGDFAGASAF